ncbi:hypothetical protein V6N12_051083 [Hibiscus sabdariffa]|uniref:Uncharacterized protein n=1 Tax=Hibiscus sabdariffa TaxID=183260 RepID=A0ABR2GEC7_9ROSI
MRSASHMVDEAINAIFVGNDGFNHGHHASAETSLLLGECEMMGGENSEILTKKARKLLALGKSLGIRIKVNEEEARIEIAFPQETKNESVSMVEASRLWFDEHFEFSTVKRFGKLSEQAKLWESLFVMVLTILNKRVIGGDFSAVRHKVCLSFALTMFFVRVTLKLLAGDS